MTKPVQKPAKKTQEFDNPLLLLLEQKKETIKAVRAGKPASSVPSLEELARRKKNG